MTIIASRNQRGLAVSDVLFASNNEEPEVQVVQLLDAYGVPITPAKQADFPFGAGSKSFASMSGVPAYTGYATPTDLLTLSNPVGSGKLIRIANWITLLWATAATTADISYLRRTTLNTGGTPTNITPVAIDSADAGLGVGILTTYAAAPTLGTLGGLLGHITKQAVSIDTSTPATCSTASPLPTGNGITAHKPPTIRPGECFSFNWNGASIPAGFKLGWQLVWAEDPIPA